jgi:hypothetical protein
MEKEEAQGVSSFLLSKSYGQAWIPDEVLEEAIHMGTGNEGSQAGIYKLYQENATYKEKIDYLEEAYKDTDYYNETTNESVIGVQTLTQMGIKITWIS